MRSRLTGAMFTVVLLLFSTCPVSAQTDEMVGSAYLETMIQTEGKAKVVVARGQTQYREAVTLGNKRKIKLASPILKHAMVNAAIAGDFVATLKNGGKIKRKHAKRCRTLNTELSSALMLLYKGKFSQVNAIIIKVEQIIILQPQPVNLNIVNYQFNLIQQQITNFTQAKQKGKKRLKRLKNHDKHLNARGGSKKNGSKKGGTVVVNGSNNAGTSVVVVKKGGSKKGGTVVVVPPVVVTPAVVIRPVPCDGTLDPGPCWTCSGGFLVPNNTKNTGIACYACSNGFLVVDTGLPCNDGDACTVKDACTPFGFCLGQPVVSPVAPCTDGLSQSQIQI